MTGMQRLVAGFRLFSGVFLFIVFNFSPAEDPVALLVVCNVFRAFFSPWTFWRISAQSWCVDEWLLCCNKVKPHSW